MASGSQEPLDRLLLGGRGDLRHALDAAAAAARLLRQHVVARGLPVQHLAVAGHAEPLRGGAVRLLLRHRSLSFVVRSTGRSWLYDASSATACASTVSSPAPEASTVSAV